MKRAAEAVATTLHQMIAHAQLGMTTLELDELGAKILASQGARSAPKVEYDFPGYTCISLNTEAAHGIPSATKRLKEGDLLNIDVSAELDGFYGDNGCSFIIGQDIHGLQPLVDASKQILLAAIARCKARTRISEVGGFIEQQAKLKGFTTLKNLVGHGIGYALHEAPKELPCFKDRTNRNRFRKGSVVALETFISTKARYVEEGPDGWTLSANDGSYVAQHEHTFVITEDEPIILTQNNGI